jgi:UV DNA damage repair endonuclease
MKVGFCCKFVTDDKVLLEKMNFKSTTLTYFNKLTIENKFIKLRELNMHNINVLENMLNYLSNKPDEYRMFRITSDFFAFRNHIASKDFYSDFINEIKHKMFQLGEFARKNNIRLSFHPGQFVILNNPDKIKLQKSVDEFNSHGEIAELLGFTEKSQNGFAINIHVGGKAFSPKMVEHHKQQLSYVSQNMLTLENDEFCWGVDELLAELTTIPIVLDVHHHWIKTGEYIDLKSDQVKKIIDSWQGVRPKMHFALSREDVLINHDPNSMPDFTTLNEKFTRSHLRAHSDMAWNNAVLDWLYDFTEFFDIQFEGKSKNLAQEQILKYWGY